MNNFVKWIGAASITGLVALASTSALAVPVLSFENAQAAIERTYQSGDTISLNVWLSGLDTSDMGGFNLDLTFNGAVTQFLGATSALTLLTACFGIR